MLGEGAASAAPKKIEIYTDGACSMNPGPGGWAAILLYRGHRKELSGFEARTTNNRMEILAAIRGLEALKEPCEVELYSDSAYLVNAVQKSWIARWAANGWLLSDKKSETKNADLWQTLAVLLKVHKTRFIKVRGHADNELNNRCDELATGEIAAHIRDNDTSDD